MAKRVTLHRDFKITAKQVQRAFTKQANEKLKSLVKHILISLEQTATTFGNKRPYATGNYARSFRFSFGSVGKNQDYGFFGGSGYGIEGISRITFSKMEQSRYISFYNIASKESNDGSLFHYAGLVDKYGWKSWSFDKKGRPRYKHTEPWVIMDTVFSKIMLNPVYASLLSNGSESIPEGWE